MKNLRFLVPVALLCLVFNSCMKQDQSQTQIEDTMLRTDATNTVDFSNVDFRALFANYDLNTIDRAPDVTPVYATDADATVLDGESKLHRTHNKLNVNFSANEAPNWDVSGHAVTLWMLVWSSADEAFAGAHPYAMYRIGGKVCGENSLNITGIVHEGETGNDYYYTGQDYSMPFNDAENDFVLFIAKSHGDMIPEMMPAQIHTFNGGCEDDPDGALPLPPCHEYAYAFHF